MQEKTKAQDIFSSFMKKQIETKKKQAEVKAVGKNKKEKNPKDAKQEGENQEDATDQEEMTEEEELEDAKKASKNKAAQVDQTEMLKKLFLENFVKYAILVAVLVIVAIAVIKFGSAFLAMVNGLVFKALMGALGAK